MANSLEDMTVDELLNFAKGASVSHTMMNSLVNNPATRERTLRIMKEAYPTMPIPEIDARDAIGTEVTETNKRLDALQTELQNRDIRDRINSERNAIQRKHNLSDADLLEVEKLMVDETAPIPYYESAAKVYLASKQHAVPTASSLSPPVFDMPDQAVWSGGIGNRARLDKIGIEQAFAALNEIKSGKVAGN